MSRQASRLNAAEIATMILAEMIAAAKVEGVRFDAEQAAFIEQALSDAALEAFLQILRELRDATQRASGGVVA